MKKCFFCNKVVETPIHLTEIKDDGSVESINMCEKCGAQYLTDPEPQAPSMDLTHIKTPEQLLDLLASIRPESKKTRPPCICGMTEDNFESRGRFGCPLCYQHFRDKMEELVFPFHGAKAHVGKRPKHQIQDRLLNDPVEREKVLRLQLAKAIELENYEKASEIKEQLRTLKNPSPHPEVSEGQ